ncbi:MAG TPA: protein translocase subunit SecF [Myxococcota bacterium]|nr:protein translocase subunit SecF [Myxococcota bacterium]
MSFEIIKPGTKIDFLGQWRIWVGLSIALIVGGLVCAIPAVRGVHFGVDFAGGAEMHVKFASGVSASDGAIRSALAPLGLESLEAIQFGSESDYLVRFQGERVIAGADSRASALNERTDRVLAVQGALERAIGSLSVERVEFVGPKVGKELRNRGLQAMGLAFLLILAYVAFRFSASFAPGAVIALVHDVLVTSSIWVILGLEFDLNVLAALLAIIGYSINDTIIIYDRARENMELHTGAEIKALLNQSVNQTLSRTALTALISLGAVLSLLIAGGPAIRGFAGAMTIGTVVGTYSTIFIAAPMVMWLETRRRKRAKLVPKAPAKAGAKKR